ncbi:pyridoxamine 5'-phosphate oxidase family protein [Bosea sp. ANAM02]|uniref:HugZ family pyridoxamine 5'-phosphate oxidase n=1 Tax=Bosea sp. ANAM02 TaxID=2020412 RepID=UPI00140F1CED|nr:pyridoxamine 5'-phosphate oxidase family protein [Bosea sp. ANAM02]BCB21735.1 pyridoxamine 5'-phosphate oxidase-like FMN-binding protein [Bosea sp. ANAM02]
MAKATKDVIQPMDEAVRAEAKALLREARSAALATLGPDGHPSASLVGLATDIDGTPIILISALAAHTANIAGDPRASLLISPGGKGDPLAHARITLKVRARRIERESEDGIRIRRRYLARQPKSALYADFPDFSFFALDIEGASLNGGFARAFAPTSDDLLSDPVHAAALAEVEAGAVAHMNEDHADAIGLYATQLLGAKPGDWRVVGLDPDGLDMALGSVALRLPFTASVDGPGGLRRALAELASKARAQAA